MHRVNSTLIVRVETKETEVAVILLQIIAYWFSSREIKHGGGRTMQLHEFKSKNHQTEL